MKRIALTQGQYALVDDGDFERLNQVKWRVRKNGIWGLYARRHSPMINGKRHEIHMHHEVIGRLPGFETDHIDGDGLNNQKNNLRHVTTRQNQQNQKKQKTSKYSGVSWYKQTKKWKAQIQINGTVKSIGYFVNEFEAFKAYRRAVNAIGEEVLGEIN